MWMKSRPPWMRAERSTIPGGLSGRDMAYTITRCEDELYDAARGPTSPRWRPLRLAPPVAARDDSSGTRTGTDFEETVVRCRVCSERIVGRPGPGPMWVHDFNGRSTAYEYVDHVLTRHEASPEVRA